MKQPMPEGSGKLHFLNPRMDGNHRLAGSHEDLKKITTHRRFNTGIHFYSHPI